MDAKEWSEEAPRDCPVCYQPLRIVDERGGYCVDHFWVVPSLEHRLRLRINALQQQLADAESSLREVMSDKFELALHLADAEAKAARYEEALKKIAAPGIAMALYRQTHQGNRDLARTALNPPPPITPEGDAPNAREEQA